MLSQGATTIRFPLAKLICLITLVATLLVSPHTMAQVLSGSLTGNVTDPTGALVPNASVKASNVETGVSYNTSTNDAGAFLFAALPPGDYTITITAPSFSSVTQTGIRIDVNAVVRANVQLKVAGVTETVSVNSGLEALQTDRGDIHEQISTQQLTDLPESGSTGRNFENLLKLVPGIQPPAEQNSAAGNPERAMAFNVNGIANVSNNVRLDGAPDIYTWLPYLVAYVPPEEAIEEVNIETNSFLPEQGTAGGSAVNVIIRSGTNSFHGAAWEYNTNTDFNARPFFFTGTQVPKNILNQFGARLGGPIRHNKLFFFGDWERTLQRQAVSGFGSLPTDAVKSGNFQGTGTVIYDPTTGNPDGTGRTPFSNSMIPASRIAFATSTYLKLLPEPNLSTANSLNNYFGAADYALTRDNADGKLDYYPDEQNHIFGRYSISKGVIADPYQFGAADGGTWDGGQPGAATITVQTAALDGTHTFSPNMLLSGTLGFTRQRLGAQAPDVNSSIGLNTLMIPGTNTGPLQGGIPFFQVTGGWTNFGNASTGSPFLFRDNSWVANLKYSWVKGPHQIAFGWDYTHGQINHFQPQGGNFASARGSFMFTGALTTLNGGPGPNQYNSFADFLLGLPNQIGKVTQFINPNSLRMSTWAFYAQDQWQVTPKLTLTYGLRYEYYPFVARDHEGNFTYQPATNTVLVGCENGVPCDTGVDVGWGFIAPRLGFAYRLDDRTVIRGGVGLTEDPDNFRDMRNTYPAVITYLNQANAFQAAGSLATGIPPVVGPNIALGKLPLPANVGTQAVANPFHRGYIESYNLSVQRALGGGFTLTTAYVGTHEVRQMSNVNINASCVGCGNAGRLLFVQYGTVNGDINESEPFGTVRYDAWQSQLSRRAGSAQMGVVYTWSRAMDMADNSTYNGLTFAYPAYWARNWAATGYDRTQNFQFWSTYALPFGKSRRWFNQGVGAYVFGGWQANAVFSAATGTPFNVTASNNLLNGPGNTEVANQVLGSVNILGAIGPGQQWFDPAAYAAPAQNTYGNSGRNSLRGPGFFELDASVFRDFSPSEKFKVQLRAESFAVTNTPIFANPNANVSSPANFGQITSLAVAANGVTAGGGYRIIRLGMRFSF
jgi:Carboxypeptidase regulatory-like domain